MFTNNFQEFISRWGLEYLIFKAKKNKASVKCLSKLTNLTAWSYTKYYDITLSRFFNSWGWNLEN